MFIIVVTGFIFLLFHEKSSHMNNLRCSSNYSKFILSFFGGVFFCITLHTYIISLVSGCRAMLVHHSSSSSKLQNFSIIVNIWWERPVWASLSPSVLHTQGLKRSHLCCKYSTHWYMRIFFQHILFLLGICEVNALRALKELLLSHARKNHVAFCS